MIYVQIKQYCMSTDQDEWYFATDNRDVPIAFNTTEQAKAYIHNFKLKWGTLGLEFKIIKMQEDE